jgi:tRNA threonylcarbamoyladenosine biosynthesis protein TsaB
MTFLAIDTSGDYAVLALADEAGAITAVSIFEGRRTLSQRLLGRIDTLLRDNGMVLSDLSAFAVGVGPGSFTGVRVGVTTMKTFAQALGKALVGVGTLDAYAAAASTGGPSHVVVPILPSRREEAYAAVYRGGAAIEEPFAQSLTDLAERIESLRAGYDVVVCGRSDLLPGIDTPILLQPWTPPDGLVRLAAARLIAGDTDDPLGLTPVYVVPPVITTPKDRSILPG